MPQYYHKSPYRRKSFEHIRLPDVHRALLKATRELTRLYPHEGDEEDQLLLGTGDTDSEAEYPEQPGQPPQFLQQVLVPPEQLEPAKPTKRRSRKRRSTAAVKSFLGEKAELQDDDDEGSNGESHMYSSDDSSDVSVSTPAVGDFDATKWGHKVLELLGNLNTQEEFERMSSLKSDLATQLKHANYIVGDVEIEEHEALSDEAGFASAEEELTFLSRSQELMFLKTLDSFRVRIEEAKAEQYAKTQARRRKKKVFTFDGMKRYKVKKHRTVQSVVVTSSPVVEKVIEKPVNVGAELLAIIAKQQRVISRAQVKAEVLKQETTVHKACLDHMSEYVAGKRGHPLDEAMEQVICQFLIGQGKDTEVESLRSQSVGPHPVGSTRSVKPSAQDNLKREEIESIKRKAEELKEAMVAYTQHGMRAALGKKPTKVAAALPNERKARNSLRLIVRRQRSKDRQMGSKEASVAEAAPISPANLGTDDNDAEGIIKSDTLKQILENSEYSTRMLEHDREIFLTSVAKADVASRWLAGICSSVQMPEPGSQKTPQLLWISPDELKLQMTKIGLATSFVRSAPAVESNSDIAALPSEPRRRDFTSMRTKLSAAARSAARLRLVTSVMNKDDQIADGDNAAPGDDATVGGGVYSAVETTEFGSKETVLKGIQERQKRFAALTAQIELGASRQDKDCTASGQPSEENELARTSPVAETAALMERLRKGDGAQILNELHEKRFRMERMFTRLRSLSSIAANSKQNESETGTQDQLVVRTDENRKSGDTDTQCQHTVGPGDTRKSDETDTRDQHAVGPGERRIAEETGTRDRHADGPSSGMSHSNKLAVTSERPDTGHAGGRESRQNSDAGGHLREDSDVHQGSGVEPNRDSVTIEEAVAESKSIRRSVTAPVDGAAECDSNEDGGDDAQKTATTPDMKRHTLADVRTSKTIAKALGNLKARGPENRNPNNMQKLLEVQSENVRLESDIEELTKMLVSLRAQGQLSDEQRLWLQKNGGSKVSLATQELQETASDFKRQVRILRKSLVRTRSDWKDVTERAAQIDEVFLEKSNTEQQLAGTAATSGVTSPTAPSTAYSTSTFMDFGSKAPSTDNRHFAFDLLKIEKGRSHQSEPNLPSTMDISVVGKSKSLGASARKVRGTLHRFGSLGLGGGPMGVYSQVKERLSEKEKGLSVGGHPLSRPTRPARWLIGDESQGEHDLGIPNLRLSGQASAVGITRGAARDATLSIAGRTSLGIAGKNNSSTTAQRQRHGGLKNPSSTTLPGFFSAGILVMSASKPKSYGEPTRIDANRRKTWGARRSAERNRVSLKSLEVSGKGSAVQRLAVARTKTLPARSVSRSLAEVVDHGSLYLGAKVSEHESPDSPGGRKHKRAADGKRLTEWAALLKKGGWQRENTTVGEAAGSKAPLQDPLQDPVV